MLYHILVPFSEDFILFNLFKYITFRAFLAGIVSFFIVVFLMPYFIRKFKNLRERIKEDVPIRHKKKEGTPTAGGIVMLIGIIVSSLLLVRYDNPLVWISLFVITYMAIMGFYDDYKKMTSKGKVDGLKKLPKFILQSILSIIIFIFVILYYPSEIATKTQILFFKNIMIDFSFFYPVFIFFVFVGTTNALNLTDGLDGLAGSSSIPPLITFLIIAYITSHAIISKYLNILHIPETGELTIIISSIVGSLLGFLWYNTYPAEIFMGDTGSQMLGGAFGIFAILTKQEILLAIAGGLFVIETLSVILQVGYFKWTKKKYGEGRRIFKRAPLHHHFEELGWEEPKIVSRFLIISTIFSILALATLKIR
ncbi:MAG: phospho-N-acetylmuramoyl-pentapeptide-transferase [candidate division WOR-3 bacterium]|nr:phospho-N-acetylmuramoyl-pentapeptide-transferase [candidate division WOR-3 bacterium]